MASNGLLFLKVFVVMRQKFRVSTPDPHLGRIPPEGLLTRKGGSSIPYENLLAGTRSAANVLIMWGSESPDTHSEKSPASPNRI